MRQQLKHTKTANFQQIPQLHKNTQFPTKTNKLTQKHTISHKNKQFPTKTHNKIKQNPTKTHNKIKQKHTKNTTTAINSQLTKTAVPGNYRNSSLKTV